MPGKKPYLQALLIHHQPGSKLDLTRFHSIFVLSTIETNFSAAFEVLTRYFAR